MSFTTTELYKSVLSELESGALPLSVPVEDDVIQVGTFIRPSTSFTGLAVMIGQDSIDFRREDNQRLQIDDNDERLAQNRRVRLLTEPVSELTLRRPIGPMGLLRVEGEGEITDKQRFDRFLTQIFWRGYVKQNPGATAADIVQLLDRHHDF
jgi:hypothetical protein